MGLYNMLKNVSSSSLTCNYWGGTASIEAVCPTSCIVTKAQQLLKQPPSYHSIRPEYKRDMLERPILRKRGQLKH